MKELIQILLNTPLFAFQGDCCPWSPELVGLYQVADGLMAIAYYLIPVTLMYLGWKRQELPFNQGVLPLSVFILACGTTNLVDGWMLEHSIYWLLGVLKLITTAISLYTTAILISLLSKTPTPAGLAATNQTSETEITERQKAETALRESEERFRSTFEQASVGIAHVALSGAFLQLNQRFCDIVGYTPTELQSLTFQEITHPDDLATDLQLVDDLLNLRIATYSLEKRYICKDRSLVWIDLMVSLVRDRAGEPKYFISAIADISDRKQAEAERLQAEKLRTELKLLENILEVILAGYWDWNIPSNQEYLSPTFKRMFGYDDHELPNVPETWQQMIFAEDLPRVLECFNQHVSSQGQIPYYGEVRYHHKDGSTVWVICSGRVIEWDEDAQPLRMIGCHIDITERKQAEAQLQASEAELRALFAAMTDTVIVRDRRGQCLKIAPNSSSLYREPPEMLGKTLHEVLPRREADLILAKIRECLDQQTTTSVEYCLPIHGQPVYFLASISPLSTDAGIIVARDISARKQAEEQLRISNERTSLANAELARAARLKDEFLAGMSHELRTPLNAILGLSEALLEEVYGNLTPDQQHSLQTIEKSGQHLLALINDILDLSKIESGKMDLELNTVEVRSLCESSLTFVKQQANHKQINLNFQIADGVTDLKADERRLRQVLVNLLSNAVKFTPEKGSVQLQVRADPVGEMVEFHIRDTGIGIAPENMNRLFQPFVQLDSSLSRRYEGTGLGLSLVRRIMDLHGGSVSVDSQIGRGSCFTITLPWNSTPPRIDPTPLSYGLESTLPEIERALIVEDSEAAASQIARYLTEFGAKGILYCQGKGALDIALQSQPDVIILDILLPDQSGWEVLTALKTNPATRAIPVIMVSVVDARSRGLELGAAEYLLKPITRRQLQHALNQARSVAQPSTQTDLAFASSSASTPPLILLVEDNEANITTTTLYLQAYGLTVVVARNGLEAIQIAKEDQPAVILMDIQMPEMDGLEATRYIRADAKLSHIPIIALTALAMPGDRERCLSVGANEYMVKPVSLKQLLHLIASYVPVFRSGT
jgi:PAS domain S-box-containing protein